MLPWRCPGDGAAALAATRPARALGALLAFQACCSARPLLLACVVVSLMCGCLIMPAAVPQERQQSSAASRPSLAYLEKRLEELQSRWLGAGARGVRVGWGAGAVWSCAACVHALCPLARPKLDTPGSACATRVGRCGSMAPGAQLRSLSGASRWLAHAVLPPARRGGPLEEAPQDDARPEHPARGADRLRCRALLACRVLLDLSQAGEGGSQALPAGCVPRMQLACVHVPALAAGRAAAWLRLL